jgi:hypothetical protein
MLPDANICEKISFALVQFVPGDWAAMRKHRRPSPFE